MEWGPATTREIWQHVFLEMSASKMLFSQRFEHVWTPMFFETVCLHVVFTKGAASDLSPYLFHKTVCLQTVIHTKRFDLDVCLKQISLSASNLFLKWFASKRLRSIKLGGLWKEWHGQLATVSLFGIHVKNTSIKSHRRVVYHFTVFCRNETLTIFDFFAFWPMFSFSLVSFRSASFRRTKEALSPHFGEKLWNFNEAWSRIKPKRHLEVLSTWKEEVVQPPGRADLKQHETGVQDRRSPVPTNDIGEPKPGWQCECEKGVRCKDRHQQDQKWWPHEIQCTSGWR